MCSYVCIGLDTDVVNFPESEILFQQYTGDYNNLYSRLNEFKNLKTKFKLSEDYFPFGIFYDDPSITENVNQCRAIVGIVKEMNGTKMNEELKKYLKENKYDYDSLPKTLCVNGLYCSLFNVIYFFKFVSKLLIEMTTIKFLRRVFIPKWKDNNVKKARRNYKKNFGIVEVFKGDKIELYIPIENEKDFFLHDDEAIPKRKKIIKQ